MWNPFKKKRRTPHAQPQNTGPEADRINDLANKLHAEGRTEELESELKKLSLADYSEKEQESWWHLFGIAAFQSGNDNLALARFQEAYGKHPQSAMIRFSLGQQYIRANEPELAFDLFRQCQFPEVPRDYVLFQARYAYLWGQYEDGLGFLQPFWVGYKQLKILDDHFLYVRGMPFFGTWWSYVGAFSLLKKDFKQLEEITEFVANNCHDYDFDYLKLELGALKSDSPSMLVEKIKRSLADSSNQNFPLGYQRTQLAVFEAKESKSLSDCLQCLDSVSLEKRDFPWLSDIITLAKAEAAYRFGDSEEEQKFVKHFLSKQPMLFEPDIALNFYLLQYQENLKSNVVAK